MVDRGLYPELAKAMADGVRGMQPKINVWNTGGNGGNPVADVLKNIPASVDMLYFGCIWVERDAVLTRNTADRRSSG